MTVRSVSSPAKIVCYLFAKSPDFLEQVKIQDHPTGFTEYLRQQAKIDPDKLLYTSAFDLSQLLKNNPDFLPSNENYEDHAHYSDSMQSISFEIEGNLDPDRVISWFQWLHFTYGPNLVRTKGILSMDDSDQQVIFHGVYTNFECTHAQPWGNKPRKSRIVLIGKELNREEIENELLKCKTSI